MGEEYKIQLGVDIDVDDIQTQINIAENKVNPIKLNVEIENLNEIKQQLQNLGGTKGKTKIDIPINAQSIEQSLTRVANAIDDIKDSLGSLKSESGMKSLLSSVNQIATALGKAEDESKNLVNSLNALANKDFSINFGVKLGGSNSVSNNTAYGNLVKSEIIPELQRQEKAIASYLAQHYKTNELSAINRLAGNNLGGIGGIIGILDKLEQPVKKGDNLNDRMREFQDYFNVIKKAAALEGVDLTSVLSDFDKQADELIRDAHNIKNGVQEAKDSVAEFEDVLKRAFGGGISSEQLDSIVKDLGEIKNSLKGLSESISIDEITQSFKEMSVVLKDITDNLVIFRNAFGNVGNGLSASVGNATQGLKNGSNILDTFKRSLKNIGMGADEIDIVANRIKSLGVQIETLNQKKSLNGDKEILAVDISGIDKFGNAVKLTQEYNVATGDLIKSVDKVSTVHQKAGKSADTFAKQQQRAVTDLTNQINQLNRAAIDQNAARPIKETAHLDSLESKYHEIISAIERMGAASNKTFEDERNKVKTLITEYKSLKSEYKNAENVALQMDGNDFASGLEIAKNKLAEFKSQAQSFSQLTQTIKELDKAIEGVGDVSSLKEFNNQLRVAKSELSRVKTETASVSEIKFKLTDTGFDGFEQEVSRAHAAVEALKNSSPELENALKQLDAAMEAVNSADEVDDVQKLVLANKDYETALRQVYSQLKLHQQIERDASKDASFEAAKEGALLRLKSLFSENSEAAKIFGERLNQIQRELDKCGDAKGLAKINREIANLGKEIKNADVKTQTFSQRFKKQWQQYTSYFSVAFLFSYASQGLRSMFEQVKLIDSAMTELKKVTNETDESYNKFLSNAADRAKEIGTTIDGLVESTADFARLGYGFEDSQKLAEVANIYAVVGDEIEGVEDATQSLVSTMAAFKEEMNELSDSDFALSIVDKMNEVANNYSISSGGIGEALQRSASSMAAANNTLDETIAMITAANEVAQNPEKVGNAMKTISMRIRGAKSELEDAGESTEGMVESTATLRAEIEALSGVDIMLNESEFKSTYQILDELSQKWKDLSDIQQATIIELMAGKHQGNIFASLMQNFGTAREALETSLNSAGSAMKEHEKWQQSLEAQINKLKASWQGLSQAFLKSDFLKVGLKGITALIDGLTALLDTFGALPTILGAVAAGMSLFKNKGLFTFDKQAQSIQLFGTQLSGLGEKYALVQSKIARYNSLSAKSQEALRIQWANSNTSFGKYISGLNGAKASFGGYVKSLVGAKAATIGLQIATTAMNAALTMGISMLVSWAFEGVMKLINAKKELAEEVEELTSKFQEQHGELKKLKGNYDTSDEDSMISKYEKLSKGVDNLGRNVSLTADEYSEYQSIVNQIAEQIPSLVSGYDSQGNAILSVKGNVEELTEAYEKLIHAQNNEILTNAGDIEKNFKNVAKHANGYGFWEAMGNSLSFDGVFGGQIDNFDMKADTVKWLESLSANTSIEDIRKGLADGSDSRKLEITQALQMAGYDVNRYSSVSKVLKEVLEKEPTKIKGIIDNYYSQFAEVVTQSKSIAQAKLSEAFDVSSSISGLDYENISENWQAIAYQTVNGLDDKFFLNLQEKGKTVEQWTTEMLDQINSISAQDNARIETAFDLQTQFNGGEVSYGEYVNGLKDVDKIINDPNSFHLKAQAKNQLKSSLGLDDGGILDEYDALVNRLSGLKEKNVVIGRDGIVNVLQKRKVYDEENHGFDINADEAKEFLNSLSVEEYSVAVDIITQMSDNGVKETVDDIRNAIDKEMTIRGLTLELDVELEKSKLEALTAALTESVSGTGLSSDSITAIEDIFSGTRGYDPSKLFERTAHGISLNNDEYRKLNSEYRKTNVAKVNKEMDTLGDIYNQTREELYRLTYGTDEYNSKSAELKNIEDRIKATEQLAAQYKGLASAYQEWQMAESSGSQRDMYENVIEGWENVGDEISRGWIDDGTIEFLELLKGETATIDGKSINIATASTKELKQVWKSLDDTIKHTTYSVRDFFTVDEDGNSTADGVYNFLDAIGQMEEEKFGGKDVVRRDKNGNVIGFNFDLVGGDEVIAEALGVSEELVQIMKRAADDAGFVVSFDGTYQQLDILREKAQTASESLNQILKKNGKKGYSFNFNSSDVEDITKQLSEANKILDGFRNKDGTINTKLEGADEALTVASTLQSMLDKLTRPAYMKIETSQVEDDIREPLKNLQELRTLTETEHQLKLTGADTSNLEESKQEIYDYFETLSPEVKAELGLVDSKGNPLTGKSLQDKLNSGDITIAATIDIQMEMDEKLGILVDKALYDAGIIDKEEFTKRVNVYLEADVDNDDAKDKTENAVDDITKDEERKQNIEIIAETFGVEDVDDLSSKLEILDDKFIQAVVEAIGQTDVDKLQNAVKGLTHKEVKAIAEAIGEGDVKQLQSSIKKLSPRKVQAIAEALGYDDVNELCGAIDGMNGNDVQAIAHALGITDVWSLQDAVDNMQGNVVYAEVNTDGQSSKIDTLQSAIDGMHGTTVDIFVNTIKTVKNIVENGASAGKKARNKRFGTSDVNGTAYVNGAAGRAYKQGSWGTKVSGTALVGELGREVLVRDGRYYTIGDNGAEFIKYKKDDIIFNHKQTEELFKNGKVTADGGRAKAFVQGTAFADGKYGGSAVNSDDFEETFDWIERLFSRLERTVNKLDDAVNNVYDSWENRKKSLENEISVVNLSYNKANEAKGVYGAELNEIAATLIKTAGSDKAQEYIKDIRQGDLRLEDFKGKTDEQTYNAIQEYIDIYEKYLDAEDKATEAQQTASKLQSQKFDNIIAEYDGILQGFEHTESMLNEYISQAEAKGHIVSKSYYQALIDNERQNIATLRDEQSDLIAQRDAAVASGKIVEGSQAWYDMCSEIDGVTQAIEEAETATIEWNNAIRDIDWQVFDLIQERISDVTAEANFLIDLMSYDKLFDDNGKLTDKGIATMGLHGQNYNAYMYQADDYGNKVKEIDNKIASGELDGYSAEVIAKRREYVELQRKAILNAEDEKQAIKDLVEEGINLELDALQERIDLHSEELESMKDLYDYQKNVEEQTKNIASLQKQLKAYEGFNDEETRATVQKLKVELESAQQDLEETQYDKFISDQSALLDELFLEYENVLNTRLDDTNALITQVIDAVNIAAGAEGIITTALGSEGAIAGMLNSGTTTIKTTLETEANKVGANLSTAMNNIWSVGEGNAKSVIETYGKGFQDKQTTTNIELGKIVADVNAMVNDADKEAETEIDNNSTQPSSKADPTKDVKPSKKEEPKKEDKPKVTNDTLQGIAAAIWIYGKDSGWGNNPFRENKLTDKLGAENAKKVQDIVNAQGKSGGLYSYWVKTGFSKLNKYRYNAFASGARNIHESQLAWTQENGQEFIVRPSDGAILTPIAKGDSVLTSAASSNIWDMANSPADFIKDNLKFGDANVPNNSNVRNVYHQNLEKVTISLPNVHNYNEFLSEMQKDKNFKRLIESMTINQIAGKSSLGVNKSIR